MPKQQRFCIFCNGAGLTREHFWPDWAATLLPNYTKPTYQTGRLDFTRKFIQVPGGKFTNRQGGLHTKTVRVVCKTCNTGWMSRLETDTKRVLGPILRAESIAIDSPMQEGLARWIALKTMIVEHDSPDNHVTTAETRKRFRTNQTVPDEFRIWVAQSTGPLWWTRMLRHSANIAVPPNIQLGISPKNFQSVTFGIGPLFVVVASSIAPGLDIDELIMTSDTMVRLHPPSVGVIEWPRPKVISDAAAEKASRWLDNLIAQPRVRWRPMPTSDT